MQEWLQRTIETFQYGDDETPYVTIRSLVEKIGLHWPTERDRLREAEHWGYREEMIQGEEGLQLVAGLPANRVFVWLKQIDVSKVLPELRKPLFEYQEQSRQMTQDAFLRSDLLAHARNKPEAERSPLEKRLVEAAQLLEQKDNDNS